MLVYVYIIRVLFYDIILDPQFLSCDVIYGLVASSSSYNAYDIIESQFASRPISFYANTG